nr:MAG TPA: hypothetical protein [Caudoviricetes sp.]
MYLLNIHLQHITSNSYRMVQHYTCLSGHYLVHLNLLGYM